MLARSCWGKLHVADGGVFHLGEAQEHLSSNDDGADIPTWWYITTTASHRKYTRAPRKDPNFISSSCLACVHDSAHNTLSWRLYNACLVDYEIPIMFPFQQHEEIQKSVPSGSEGIIGRTLFSTFFIITS